MYTPMYRFRYKFDSKQNKYIPTNEWFMDKVVLRKQGGNLNKVLFALKGKPIIKFGVLGRNPKDTNRTPLWDAEEDKIFNPTEDDNFLKSENISYTRNGNYYLDEKGKYIPGVIYHSPDGKTWNHYLLHENGIEGFDKRNLSQEQYNLYKTLGIDPTKFYRNAEEAEDYRPNPELVLPEGTKKVGNSTITFKATFPHTNKAISRNSLRDYTDYGSWHVVDPDKGYDFTIRSGRLRDGGSRTISLNGNYPKEWDLYNGIIRYNGFHKDDGSAEIRRNALNNLLKQYELQFDKQGGKLTKYLFGGKNLPTAPKAENRYKKGEKYLHVNPNWDNSTDPTRIFRGVKTKDIIPGEIVESILYSPLGTAVDTTYSETPPSWLPVKRVTRVASGLYKTPLYDTLKRRFNTAWNLAK